MNRTMSALDRDFHQLRDTNQRLIQLETLESHSLNKIEERVKKGRKKSKSKARHSKSNIDVFDFKSNKKSTELPSIQHIEHMFSRDKFHPKMNFSEANSRQNSDFD